MLHHQPLKWPIFAEVSNNELNGIIMNQMIQTIGIPFQGHLLFGENGKKNPKNGVQID